MKHNKNVPYLIEISTESMDIEQYQFWFDALRNNNEGTVVATLNQSGKDEKHRLLNGRFKYNDDKNLQDFLTHTRRSNFDTTRPIILAGISGSHEVLACLLQQGSDPYCLEEGDHNLLHSMVLVVNCFPQQEEDQVQWYSKGSKILGSERMSML